MSIKPFDFADYIDVQWNDWKKQALEEAMNDAIDQKNLMAGAKNKSKAPKLWDEDDWKFLIQFPTNLWPQALKWRYNEGLLQAAKDREPWSQGKQVPDWHETGDVKLIANGKTYVFEDVYLGLKSLIEKLEKPIKNNKAHDIHGTDEGSHGIQDVDPLDNNERLEDGTPNPKWRGHYKQGLYDYDLTDPQHVNDAYFDTIPDDKIKLPAGVDRTPENIKKKREQLKKTAQHTFGGFHVLQDDVAKKSIQTWMQAQGIGLLGDVPKKVVDPITGEEKELSHVSPGWINKKWATHLGDSEDGQQHALSLPSFSRNITYRIEDKNGELSEPVTQEIRVPVLNSGKILPNVKLKPDQRRKLALRRLKTQGLGINDICDKGVGAYENDWSYVETNCQAIKKYGQPDGFDNLLKHWDILDEEQKKHLKDNQRDLVHFAAASKNPQYKDPWSKLKDNYAIGYHTNKGERGTQPMELEPEQVKQVTAKYFDTFYQQAMDALDGFIAQMRGYDSSGRKITKPPTYSRDPKTIDLIESMQMDFARVAAAFMVMNANHTHKGVYDPDLGLKNATGEEEMHEHARKNSVWDFAADISQAAFGNNRSRRMKGKKILTGGSGGEEDSGFDSYATDKNKDLGSADWDTRRDQLAPHDQIARRGWNTMEIGHEIDGIFATYFKDVKKFMGSYYAQDIDKVKEKIKIEAQLINDLYEKGTQQAVAQGMSPEEAERAGHENVKKNLKTQLATQYPDLYKDIGDQDIEDILKKNADNMQGIKLPPELQEEYDGEMEIFFEELIENGKAILPKVEYDKNTKQWRLAPVEPEPKPKNANDKFFHNDEEDEVKKIINSRTISLKNFRQATPEYIVEFIRMYWPNNEEGVRKYAAPLLAAIFKSRGQPMSPQEADAAIKKTGLLRDNAPQQQPVRQPQQPAVKQAATDTTQQLLPQDWEEKIQDPQWVAQNRQMLQAVYDNLRKELALPGGFNDNKKIHMAGELLDVLDV